jgi:hypothetical protein
VFLTQEEIFWLKFLQLLKLLFSAGKCTEKKLFQTQPERKDIKNYQIVEKKNALTVFASLK